VSLGPAAAGPQANDTHDILKPLAAYLEMNGLTNSNFLGKLTMVNSNKVNPMLCVNS
jgi:hypothetical protein